MEIRVRLFGTLGWNFPDHDPATGFKMDIAKNATVADLLVRLKFAESHGTVVAVGGKILKPGDMLTGGAVVNVFQSVFGG